MGFGTTPTDTGPHTYTEEERPLDENKGLPCPRPSPDNWSVVQKGSESRSPRSGESQPTSRRGPVYFSSPRWSWVRTDGVTRSGSYVPKSRRSTAPSRVVEVGGPSRNYRPLPRGRGWEDRDVRNVRLWSRAKAPGFSCLECHLFYYLKKLFKKKGLLKKTRSGASPVSPLLSREVHGIFHRSHLNPLFIRRSQSSNSPDPIRPQSQSDRD